MQPGQFLINNKNGDKRMVLGVLGNLVALGWLTGSEDEENFHSWHSKKELEKNGWSLLEEPWVPKNEDWVWVVFCGGDIGERKWDSFDEEEKNFVLNIGNYGRTKDEAKLHRQKLIERMGKK